MVVLQEFSPWLQWLMFDAILTLVVSYASRRFWRLKPVFRAIGWI
jgi:hypothetical protein